MFRALVVSLLAGLVVFAYLSLVAPTVANPSDLSHSVVKVEVGSLGSGDGGSGVYVGHGLIITASHVATQAEQIFGPPLPFATAPRNDLWVTDYDGHTYHAAIVYVSEEYDYTILRVKDFKDISASLSCEVTHANQPVTLIGQPLLTFPWAIEHGIVASDKTMNIPRLHETNLVSLSVSALPGDSGGPVFNTDGKVVGILVVNAEGGGYSAMVASSDICSEFPR